MDWLRVDRPTDRMLRAMCRGRKAWSTDEPTAEEIGAHLQKFPHTTIVTSTRRKAEELNGLALQALFRGKRPIVTLDGEIDVNPENYNRDGFRTDRQPLPSRVPIYRGAQLYLAQNIRKEDDLINGMRCEVLRYRAHRFGGVLQVRTKTGHVLAVTMWTNSKVEGHPVRHFPIRLGYASTIHKVQGDEFRHITICMDKKYMPAAGYTAMSRVAGSKDYCLAGKDISREHFVPAHWQREG